MSKRRDQEHRIAKTRQRLGIIQASLAFFPGKNVASARRQIRNTTRLLRALERDRL